MDFFEVLDKRCSQRSFKSIGIEKWKIERILNSINSAPSAGNLQAYKVILVDNKDVLSELSRAAWEQDFILEAPLALIFCADCKKSTTRYGNRGERLYSIQDATIATTFAHLTATALGLSSVWVGSFKEEEVKKALKLKNYLIPIAILPIGYALKEEGIKTSRCDINEIIERF